MPVLSIKSEIFPVSAEPLRTGSVVTRSAAQFQVTMALILSTLTLGEIWLARRVQLGGMGQLLEAWPGFLLLLGCFYYCGRRPLPRLVMPCEMAVWAVLSSNVLAFMIQLAARSRFPLVDAQLAALDRAMHFDTAAVAQFAARMPALQGGLSLAYAAIPALVFAAILLPAFYGLGHASRRYVLAVVVATVVTSVLFAIWPACGPWTTEHLQATAEQAAVTSRLVLLKSSAPAVFELKHTALVSFPSFHVVLAILSAVALHGLPRLRRYAWALAVPTCLSTITTGWHYGVDVLGGFVVAAAAWCIAAQVVPGAASSGAK